LSRRRGEGSNGVYTPSGLNRKGAFLAKGQSRVAWNFKKEYHIIEVDGFWIYLITWGCQGVGGWVGSWVRGAVDNILAKRWLCGEVWWVVCWWGNQLPPTPPPRESIFVGIAPSVIDIEG